MGEKNIEEKFGLVNGTRVGTDQCFGVVVTLEGQPLRRRKVSLRLPSQETASLLIELFLVVGMGHFF